MPRNISMIIQLRGTSGSGKTHLVKEIMKLYEKRKPVFSQGRKRPIAYRLSDTKCPKELAVIGHYETACGGCDTISTPGKSYEIIFNQIKRNALDGRSVLFEGLLISGDLNWTASLKELGIPLLIIELTVPLEECLKSVNNRRRNRLENKGKEFTPVKPQNTKAKFKLCQKVCEKLEKDYGISVERLNREEAFNRIRELLNI